MIRHVVIWKFKEKAEGYDRSTNLERVKGELEALPLRMPGVIQRMEVGINSLENGTNFDLILVADFDSYEALASYLANPEHQKVADLVMRVREQRAAVDYEV
ncbi:MAG: Dabb family protein [Methanomassiliicoccales archaeon]|jgi:antibiotic biosynthesis monooxygenase (ABM) superfamily enzyme|nr:Dabb family protein [Methanomassiliicoccales archaeon]MDD1756329.1 Dabb family protein [Methanomassiliicoccales archaeon]